MVVNTINDTDRSSCSSNKDIYMQCSNVYEFSVYLALVSTWKLIFVHSIFTQYNFQ